jgi:hypothetical protein
MAQLTGVHQTYMDTTRREDLLDRIADVSPDSNYLSTILGSVPVSQTLHEWTEYYQARETSNAKSVEGDDNVFADLAVPVKKNNIAQIIKEVFAVSETDVVVDKVSPKDAYAREMGWAMRRWKNKLEFAIIRGTKASGSSGVAREMNGIRNIVVADGKYTARASSVSFSEIEFRDIMTESWNQTDEFLLDLILMTGTRKGHVAAFFTTASPRTIPASDKRLVQALDVIETDYGTLVEVRAHKDIPTTGNAGEILGIKKSLCKVGHLRRPRHVPNGVSGDNVKGHIVGEATVQVDSARAMVVRSYAA